METETTQISYADFIAQNQLTFKAAPIPMRTDGNGEGAGWDKKATHWVCMLAREGCSINNPFAVQWSQGSAHKNAPKLAEVLDSLRSDAECAEEDFDGFCSSLGYETDSRRAFATYEACQQIRRNLIKLLGRTAFVQLCNSVERL